MDRIDVKNVPTPYGTTNPVPFVYFPDWVRKPSKCKTETHTMHLFSIHGVTRIERTMPIKTGKRIRQYNRAL